MSWSLLKRKEIDVIKWDSVISEHSSNLPYSYSWYLDIVCPRWEGAVLGDYSAVCALPFNQKKFGFRQLYTPFFVQQLGWISPQTISETRISNLLNLIKSSYFFIHYAFNEFNTLEKNLRQYHLKTNLVLSLSNPYGEIFKAFSKGLKYSIKRAKKENLEISSTKYSSEIKDLLQSQLQSKEKKLKSSNFTTIGKLIDYCLKNDHGKLWSVRSNEGELLSFAFFLHSKNRMINLFQASNENGRNANAISYLFDSIIRENAESEMLFDFEGSEILSIQHFMKSFGAKNQSYYVMTKKWLL